ncbi:MAG: zf-HC2 domain-containing protein [Bradymonadaceae bacterium]|nr:zf-HC2 domain-containing protein [Lujinxingiaceae bacterium]
MTCDDFSPFIGTYIDAEFDERERAEMEAHLGMCPKCRCKVEAQLSYKEEFRACLSMPRAPEQLRLRIVEELACLEFQDDGTKRTYRAQLLRYGWVAGPLAAMVAVAVVLPSFTVATASSGPLPVIEQTVDWHLGNYPLEVTTSNPAEVSRWFQGKVDFSVRLPHFPEGRANLLGGRIAHIQDRRAAYVLYEVDGAKLSVLLFHGDGLKVPSDSIRSLGERDVVVLNNKGYGIALLQDNGVTYTMTSELAEEQLVNLVALSLE